MQSPHITMQSKWIVFCTFCIWAFYFNPSLAFSADVKYYKNSTKIIKNVSNHSTFGGQHAWTSGSQPEENYRIGEHMYPLAKFLSWWLPSFSRVCCCLYWLPTQLLHHQRLSVNVLLDVYTNATTCMRSSGKIEYVIILMSNGKTGWHCENISTTILHTLTFDELLQAPLPLKVTSLYSRLF